jgi:hypothetical protein
MTQTKSIHLLSTSELLQTINPQLIAEDDLRLSVETLLNLIEELNQKVQKLEKENQLLKDENNRLKGEQGKPDIKGKKKRDKNQNYSSEKERKISHPKSKSSKNQNIKIDREEILDWDEDQLPDDAIFKGYEEVIVQDIKLVTDNIKFRKKKYYSPSTKKTYLSKLPPGYEGQFGPGIKSLVISLYYGGNMTQKKVSEFLSNIGISISTGQISNILIKNQNGFDQEHKEVYYAGLASTPWQHFDQTGARVGGENYTTNVICNPLYSSYLTTEKKDRLNVIKCLIPNNSLKFILNEESYQLLAGFGLPIKWQNALKKLPQKTVLNEEEFNTLLDEYLTGVGKVQRNRIKEASAMAYYHQQSDCPIIKTLICDDAPQFKLLTEELSLCWVHEGRHYKKLNPLIGYHQKILADFLDDFWDYYRKLLKYRECPHQEMVRKLKSEFERIFSCPSGYQELDLRKELTRAKMTELLLVLEHPELPLHNNPAELAARTMVQRRHISYGTQTELGTKAWDTFMSLVDTTRKLGISFFEYVADRISETRNIPSLATIIEEKSSLHFWGESWQV